MEYILSSKEMKNCDEKTTSQYGIPAIILMERAALETAKIIVDEYGTDIFVGVVAGNGNNGGDGIAVARILKEYGIHSEILVSGNQDHFSELMKQQIEIAQKVGIPIRYLFDTLCYDVIIDAMYGIGLSRDIEGEDRKIIQAINEADAKIISIDIPSGVNATSAKIMGCCVKADITVTYGFKKYGHILSPGTSMCGKVICVPIGIPDDLVFEQKNKAIIFNENDLTLPKRNPFGNKGTFGKVLLISGSKNMGGACQLSAMSAFRIGAGMVKVFTSASNKDSILRKIPEIMVSTYNDVQDCITENEKEELNQNIQWASVVAIGPGLSTSPKAVSILNYFLKINNKPVVIDADALNIISQDQNLLAIFEKEDLGFDVIMTPHLGEFSRLIKHPIVDIKNNFIQFARSFTHKYHVTLVLKDARTVVTRRNCTPYINISGNSGMATAGSGDVLTGIIAGLLAQGMDTHQAAVMGTFAHGLAGDIAKSNTSAYYIMSQDIIQALKYIS